MENFEKPLYTYPEKEISDIALRAAEMKEFLGAIKAAPSKAEAIREVRRLLPQFFPEIEEMPQGERTDAPNIIGGSDGTLPMFRSFLDRPLSNEFQIAKHIVEVLWQDR